MKSKRVLFGLFLGFFTLLSGTSMSQSNSGATIVEIGPDNIGGRVTSLIVDKRDATNNTLYAGASTGGLYIRSNNDEYAEFTDIWNFIPCQLDGTNRVLPISDMVQLRDNSLVIATGEGCFAQGTKLDVMASRGTGLVRYNPETGAFSRVENTNPVTHSDFAHINKLAYAYDGNTLYLYAATKGGLYRWKIQNESDWSVAPTRIGEQEEIIDLAIVEAYNMVYFAASNKLYRISSYESTNIIDVTSTNAAFAKASRIQLANSESNPDYLYAMVSASNGTFSGLYLTTKQNSWTLLTTATVAPFANETGKTCGAICVDANDNRHVYIGGSSLWSGRGFTEGAIYQWTKCSYNEYEMGSSNFMDEIFSSISYVHSGINDIIQTQVTDDKGVSRQVFYIATNAGVFQADSAFNLFENINRGLNNVQVNGVAVCTDGSLLIGASNSANLFIESRMAHHLSGVDRSSSAFAPSWYDRNGSGMNHLANEYWQGSGGQVAASRFQQYAPMSRRNLFFSADGGKYARSYADYSDYSNTQTWTIGESFLGSGATDGNPVAQMYLWETDKMSGVSSFTHKVDTLDQIFRRGKGAMTLATPASSDSTTCRGSIKAGDTILVPCVANAGFPVRHVFKRDTTITSSGFEITVDNPIKSHLFILVRDRHYANGVLVMKDKLAMSWTPSDFTRVYSTDDNGEVEPSMGWSSIYMLDKGKPMNDGLGLSTFGVSADGDMVYVVVASSKGDSCFVVRVQGIMNNIDYHGERSDISRALNYEEGPLYTSGSLLVADTLRYNGSIWFPRRISSVTFDNNNRALLTFEGHENESDFANLLVVNNADGAYSFVDKSTSGKKAAYSALVEATTGDVFVGTEDGLWKTTASSFNATPAWNIYGDFVGVPITSLVQQTNVFQLQRMTTHDGINVDNYVFPRTKFPYAIYIGTYGRGVFMDSSYVTSYVEEIVDSTDYRVGITPVVTSKGSNTVKVFPNPASVRTTIELTVANAGNAQLRVYDLSGKLVINRSMGRLAEGVHNHVVDCSGLAKGMYLINVLVGNESAATKLLVK